MEASDTREYGRALLRVTAESPLLKGVSRRTRLDAVSSLMVKLRLVSSPSMMDRKLPPMA